MVKRNDGPEKFELTLANGKTRSFKTGYDMWRWASSSSKMEFADYDRQPISLSEWFERKNSKPSK